MTFFFQIHCTPREGDVCLLQEIGDCRGAGLVTYVTDTHQLSVCGESFGFLEAHVVCSQHGMPKIKNVSSVLLSSHDLPKDAISVQCNGTERNMSSCHLDVNKNCSEIVHLICKTGDFPENTVLVGVNANSSAPFTVVSLADGVYVDGCQASTPLYCPGVYYIERTQPSIQNIIARLQPNQPCSQLGPIDLNIMMCTPPIVSTSIFDRTMDFIPTRKSALPTVTVDQAENNSELARASLSILLPFILLIPVCGVILFVCRQRRQRKRVKEIMEELETFHRINKTRHEYVKPSLVPVRPHRPVDLRRTSSLADDAVEDDLKIPFGCLTLDKEIGSGAYGLIYHGIIDCEHQAKPVEVAVKILKDMATTSEWRSLQIEIDMMKELGYHRHLVTMLAWCQEERTLALVMEYIRGGNLHEFLRNHRLKDTVSVQDKSDVKDSGEDAESSNKDDSTASSSGGSLTLINQLQLARQITLGMEYLASKNIVHRDLAARNVLVGEDQILKLADFGLSRDIKGNEGYHMKGMEDKLPVRWMAVESILDREFTLMSDVWAFGVVLWEIMTYASFPFYHLTNREVIASVKVGERLPQPDNCPNDVYDIMVQCWKQDPLHRPPIRKVRVMLDKPLDTGGYMCPVENSMAVHSATRMNCHAMHYSLPAARRHKILHSVNSSRSLV